MKLIKCHIESFGKLHDFDYVFSEGKNVILEDNGWGKSTLAIFIKVMFFGFPKRGKQNEIENERLHYNPWGKGVYGGSVVFQADGREYRIERSFDAKASKSDTFHLYDNITNLKSDDFTTNIGEELFEIDSESFQKTVFVAQQDCETDVTAGIKAKIGNVADQTADMGEYDKVDKKLKDELNSLTPDRQTGKLNKLNNEHASLEAQISAKDNIQKVLDERNEHKQELKKQKDAKDQARKELKERINQLGIDKDIQADANKYKTLKEEEAEAKRELSDATSLFKNEIPTKEKVESLRSKADKLNEQRVLAKSYEFSATDEKNYELLKEEFSKGAIDKEHYANIGNEIDELTSLRNKEKKCSLSEVEKDKLSEAKKLFENYKPEQSEVSHLSNDWTIRNSKKEALVTKKETLAQKTASEQRKNRVALSLIIILGVSIVVSGIILLFKFLILGISFIIIGFVLLALVLFKKKGKKRVSKEALAKASPNSWKSLQSEVENDEMEIQNTDDEIKLLFERMHLPYLEDEVNDKLENMKSLLNDYDNLETRERRYNTEFKQLIDEKKDIIEQFLKVYFPNVAEEEYSQKYHQLNSDNIDYDRYKKKLDNLKQAQNAVARLKEEINEALVAIGIEPEDDLANQLTGIKEQINKIDLLQKSYNDRRNNREQFEKSRDIKMITSSNLTNDESLKELNEKCDSLDNEIDKISTQENENQKDISDVQAELEQIEEAESELAQVNEKLEKLQHRYDIISKTRDYLKKAKESFTSKYMESIETSFNKYYKEIANDKMRFALDANLNFTINEQGSSHDIRFLSEGNKDLVGLCRRMAMIDAMYKGKEKPFLIFDDPFVNLDDKRLKGAMRFLNDIAKEYQVIYFICSESRDKLRI